MSMRGDNGISTGLLTMLLLLLPDHHYPMRIADIDIENKLSRLAWPPGIESKLQ